MRIQRTAEKLDPAQQRAIERGSVPLYRHIAVISGWLHHCSACGCTFQADRPHAIACSGTCQARLRRARSKAKCLVCGKSFSPERRPQSREQLTCSEPCRLRLVSVKQVGTGLVPQPRRHPKTFQGLVELAESSPEITEAVLTELQAELERRERVRHRSKIRLWQRKANAKRYAKQRKARESTQAGGGKAREAKPKRGKGRRK